MTTMSDDDDWSTGLIWSCRLCGATYPSEWARDICMMEDQEADRDVARRRAR